MNWCYKKENVPSKIKPIKRIVVDQHPLSYTSTTLSNGVHENIQPSSKIESTVSNKNIVTTSWDGLDPLTVALTSNQFCDTNLEHNHQNQEKKSYIENDFNDWPSHKTHILNKFNTSEKLSIKTSFFSEKNINNNNASKSNQNVSQKLKNRLEQLDDFDESLMHEMHNLTQQEYVNRIEDLNFALHDAWENDQRVKSLKIAIQSVKQLSSINAIHFYPSKFVLVTEILDSFGKLVYDRIYNKTNDSKESVNFAQETCKNWFYKISSIRELLPRFYIELSILKVYSFLMKNSNAQVEYEKALERLSKMIRGVGDPLVSAYCRVYLCRVTIDLCPEAKNIFECNVFDIFHSVNQLICTSVQQSLYQQKVDYSIYYTLFTPALNWIFNCLFYKASDTIFENVFSYFKKLNSSSVQSGCSALILNSLIVKYPLHFISRHLVEFIQLIKNVNKDIMIDDGTSTICTSVYPKYILIKNIGNSLNSLQDLFDLSSNKPIVLGEFWKILHKLKSKNEYISCLETWGEFFSRYCDIDEIDSLLKDVVDNMLIEREFENYSPQLLSILSKIIQFGSPRFNYNVFFSMNNLMQYLDLFHKEHLKIEACKIIVESFIQNSSNIINDKLNPNQTDTRTASDPVIINSITYLCKTLHDSINALTLEDDKRQISILIIGFIRMIYFNRDFEAQLNFYVESRANYSNLDQTLSFLVHQVNSLAMETHHVVKGHHTKKTLSFVNACIAFSYITIPSIEDIMTKLQLYLNSCHVALINVCLPQTDAFLKSAITLLRLLPPYSEGPDGKFYSNDDFLYSYVSQLLSTLIIVPDNPELGVLYIFKGLHNVLKEYKFDASSNCKTLIMTNVLRYLSTCALDTYPYHVHKVDSNDILYAQDEAFLSEIQVYCDIIFQEILEMLKKSQNEADLRRQCNYALDLINLIRNFANVDTMSTIINQLWNWVSKNHKKHNFKNIEYKMKYTLEYIKEAKVQS